MSRTQTGAILLIGLLQVASYQGWRPYPPPEAGPGTDQGWDYETTQRWQHVDQGTVTPTPAMTMAPISAPPTGAP